MLGAQKAEPHESAPAATSAIRTTRSRAVEGGVGAIVMQEFERGLRVMTGSLGLELIDGNGISPVPDGILRTRKGGWRINATDLCCDYHRAGKSKVTGARKASPAEAGRQLRFRSQQGGRGSFPARRH